VWALLQPMVMMIPIPQHGQLRFPLVTVVRERATAKSSLYSELEEKSLQIVQKKDILDSERP